MSKGSYGVAKVSNLSKMASKWPVEGSGGALGGTGRPIPEKGGGDPFFGSLLGPSWGPLGGRLGASWGRLGHLGGLLTLSWPRLGVQKLT